jgi:DNA-binding response OmpR family regulator
LLDAVMPGVDGPSLCRQMREVDATRDTPVLFLTGLPEQALVTQLIDCEGWSYLSKPCTPEELLYAVQQQVARPGISS